jgi:hypothetical protein
LAARSGSCRFVTGCMDEDQGAACMQPEFVSQTVRIACENHRGLHGIRKK